MRYLNFLVLLLLGLGSWLYLSHQAIQRFDFFDFSLFLDAGYRVFIGQIPFKDFIYHAGPVHLYMHALFFAMFGGFRTFAIQMHVWTISFIVIAGLYLVARRKLSIPLYFAFSLTTVR